MVHRIRTDGQGGKPAAWRLIVSSPPSPRAVPAEQIARRNLYRQSILDLVLEDANQLRGKVGKPDQRKLDQYLSGIREMEMRLHHSQTSAQVDEVAGFHKPDGIPKNYEEHIRLMCDLIVLAMQTDLTRISTFVLADEGSNRSYKHIDIPEGHHELSHHGNDEKKQAKITEINRFHMRQLAYSARKAQAHSRRRRHAIRQSHAGLRQRHRRWQRPQSRSFADSTRGRCRWPHIRGQHLEFPDETPLANLYVSMLDCMQVGVDRFGDSTGKLPGVLSPV